MLDRNNLPSLAKTKRLTEKERVEKTKINSFAIVNGLSNSMAALTK